MRVAHVARLYESSPPKGYGGTERSTWYLVEEQVRLGMDVTLYATGDSHTSAKLRAVTPIALRRRTDAYGFERTHVEMYRRVAAEADQFDVIHVHNDNGAHFPALAAHRHKLVTQMHYRLDQPGIGPLLWRYRDCAFVALSDAQRRTLPWLNWRATIHHGLPIGLHAARRRHGRYLAFIGRFDRDKRADRAIRLARLSGVPLKLAARHDPDLGPFAASVVKPMVDDPAIDHIGEIGDGDKSGFLGNALALVFPIDWPEPFGLALIEAMACGTPVIAWRKGAVEEIVEHGRTGFIVDDIAQACRAVEQVKTLDRREIRRRFEARFSIGVTAARFRDLYDAIVQPRLAAAV